MLNNDLEKQFKTILDLYLDKSKKPVQDSKVHQVLVMNLKRDLDQALKDANEKG